GLAHGMGFARASSRTNLPMDIRRCPLVHRWYRGGPGDSQIISISYSRGTLARRVLHGLAMKTLAVVSLGMFWTVAGCTDSGSDASEASDVDAKAPVVSGSQPGPASGQDGAPAAPASQ